jgi:hypothetical protein
VATFVTGTVLGNTVVEVVGINCSWQVSLEQWLSHVRFDAFHCAFLICLSKFNQHGNSFCLLKLKRLN